MMSALVAVGSRCVREPRSVPALWARRRFDEMWGLPLTYAGTCQARRYTWSEDVCNNRSFESAWAEV